MPYKIVYNRDRCIGAGACEALADKYWEMNKDGKVDLKGGKPEESSRDDISSGKLVRSIDDSDLELAKEFCGGCPSKAIELFSSEGKKIA